MDKWNGTNQLIIHICLYVVIIWGNALEATQPTLSPESEFIMTPQNITVLEGHPAILRCKIQDMVHNCQWFYLQHGMDLFDNHSQPILVKEFRPPQNRDCSIKLSKARIIQSGQWICKGLQIHQRKYVVSRPAFLTVISDDGDSELEGRSGNGDQNTNNESQVSFHQSYDGHIINTNIGDTTMIGCHANKELSSCTWIQPDGLTLRFDLEENAKYSQKGNLSSGNCSLLINDVSPKDEGNWRCVVSVENFQGDKLGPLIHLHIHELGAHAEGIESFFPEEEILSLPSILGVTSVVLVVIIILLVCYMYKRIWRKKSYTHNHISTNGSEKSDYSNYDPSWHPELRTRDHKFMVESSGSNFNNDPDPNCSRYLDMTGKGTKECYVMFPASSSRSSMSSRTTLSTIPVGFVSTRTSASDSMDSGSGDASVDIDHIQGRRLPARTPSVYSHDHLYEEIKYIRKPDLVSITPSEIEEENDVEGYLVPTKRLPEETHDTNKKRPQVNSEPHSEPKRAPPYSKVGEKLEAQESTTTTGAVASNPIYSVENKEEETLESYDVPKENPVPVVPVRIDSVKGPLANYDVPKKQKDITLPVFV